MKSETEIHLPGSHQGKRAAENALPIRIRELFPCADPDLAVVYREVSMTTLPHPFVNPSDAFSQLGLGVRQS
jgi:hypothetical protein